MPLPSELKPPLRRGVVSRGEVEKQMAGEIPEDLQRWTAKRRVALVTSILKGETSVQALLSVAEFVGYLR
jgi:hypothetical protein